MKAVILAGGFGTRIQPLTHSLPKPMLPILNKPMMEHIVLKLRDVGIHDIVVLLYFKPEVIKEHFKDGSDFGVNITYVTPDDDYGTAGAVRLAGELLDETFIIISADLVTDFDLQKMIDFHHAKSSKLTITLTSVEDPLQFGVVIADDDHKITKFLEKPSWGEVFSDTINTGIYILEPEILDSIPYEENFDFAKDLFPLLMKKGITLWGYTAKGYWRDVGNPLSYREVYEDIFRGDVNIGFVGDPIVFDEGTLYVDSNVKLPKEMKIIGNVVIGKNSVVANQCVLENCSIGSNVVLETGSHLSDCVIWNDVKIESKAALHRAVVCSHTFIGTKTKAKKGCIISENCEIQKGVVFEKDVIVWPDKVVEESSVVNQNIVWGSKYKSTIFENGSVFGITNIELSCQMAVKLAESYAATLPIGSTIYVARDYHRSSRMIKRAFLSGLLSSGINVIDLQLQSANVMRYSLQNHPHVKGGIQIRKSQRGEAETEIVFYDAHGILINTNTAKSIERIFFRESFRRVGVHEIGEILDENHLASDYVRALVANVDLDYLKTRELKIAADLAFGMTGELFSKVFNKLGVESIVLNAYQNEQKLSKVSLIVRKSASDLSEIVKNLQLDAGYIVYPNGQKMDIVCDQGNIFTKLQSLMALLALLNGEEKETKVLLPSYAPNFFDASFPNLKISRKSFMSLESETISQFDFVADLEGRFTFTSFSYSPDAVYATMKILEMLSRQGKKMSELLASVQPYCFDTRTIQCESRFKGKLMRKFLEFASDKMFSHEDGIKIWASGNEWIHMIPSQSDDAIYLYSQASNEESLLNLEAEYESLIHNWIAE